MLKILWKREEIAPEVQFLLLSKILCYLMLDFCVKTSVRFSLRDKRQFEITEVEITMVDCTCNGSSINYISFVMKFDHSLYIYIVIFCVFVIIYS